MKSFPVDDDLVTQVWQRANPKPFENLGFSEALRRVLATLNQNPPHEGKRTSLLTTEEMLAELDAMSEEELAALQQKVKEARAKRASSPRPASWVTSVPELRLIPDLKTWKDICDHFGIKTEGDSARRKLKGWVKSKHPQWPEVPDVG